MRRRIALISEHASPLAVLGGVDSGGQNVYVGQLASHLAELGYDVDVFTRRDSGRPAARSPGGPTASASSTCRPALPRRSARKTCCRFMGEFTDVRSASLPARSRTTWSMPTSSCRAWWLPR